MVICQDVGKVFLTYRGNVIALAHVTLSIKTNEFVCLVGPSGCGKSTLLRLIADLEKPSTGQITFATAKPIGKQRTAIVFQEYALFPWLTALDNITFALEMQGIERLERQQQAYGVIHKLGLNGFVDRYPHELSGGMRQRVSIARAWLADGDILLMDEPFGALDAQTRLLLQEELLRIWKEERKTILYVTHDIEEAILLGDRVLIMSGSPGHILEDISIPLPRPRQLLTRGETEQQKIVTELRWHIWEQLREEAHKSL